MRNAFVAATAVLTITLSTCAVAKTDVSLKWEVIEGLFWELEFYDSFDSDPVVQGAEEKDYGVITLLGWEF